MTEAVQTIMTLVGSLGFPIVAYIGMFWKMHEQDTRHSEQLDKISEIVNGNTLAINRLIDHLNKEE